MATTVEAMPDANLPKQSEFARKEALYLQTLELLGKGTAYESALVLCKELQEQYETQIFAYQRLSEILAHQVRCAFCSLTSRADDLAAIERAVQEDSIGNKALCSMLSCRLLWSRVPGCLAKQAIRIQSKRS